jgi:hypothetical protein
MPPAEAAFHPAEENDRHEFYFMCADLKAEMRDLARKNVICSPIQEERWDRSPGSAFLEAATSACTNRNIPPPSISPDPTRNCLVTSPWPGFDDRIS